MDFLWVRWFGKEPKYISGSCWAHLPKVGFVESTVPAFHKGRTVDLLPVPQSISQCLNPGDDDNWVNFYVNV